MLLADFFRRTLLAGLGGEEALIAEAARQLGVANPILYSHESRLSTTMMERPLAVSFLLRPVGFARSSYLQAAIDALGSGCRIIVVDHNQPRDMALRLRALVIALAAVPLLGHRAFERLRYPVARELQEAGLEVIRLRLLGAENIQAILAQKYPAS